MNSSNKKAAQIWPVRPKVEELADSSGWVRGAGDGAAEAAALSLSDLAASCAAKKAYSLSPAAGGLGEDAFLCNPVGCCGSSIFIRRTDTLWMFEKVTATPTGTL